jgi:hypothetical protein
MYKYPAERRWWCGGGGDDDDDDDDNDNDNHYHHHFMQGFYTHIPDTNPVPKQYNVAAILSLLFMVPISLTSVLTLMYFYISTF